jgi:hypothetical protein
MRGVLSVQVDQASHAVLRMRDTVNLSCRVLQPEGPRPKVFSTNLAITSRRSFLIDMLNYQRAGWRILLYDEEKVSCVH